MCHNKLDQCSDAILTLTRWPKRQLFDRLLFPGVKTKNPSPMRACVSVPIVREIPATMGPAESQNWDGNRAVVSTVELHVVEAQPRYGKLVGRTVVWGQTDHAATDSIMNTDCRGRSLLMPPAVNGGNRLETQPAWLCLCSMNERSGVEKWPKSAGNWLMLARMQDPRPFG